MMTDKNQDDGSVIALFSEVLAVEQLLRGKITRALPAGLELSQFMLLNYLSYQTSERTPVQLARAFNLTKGAMTNTLRKLHEAGYVHIRPDWDDGRRKLVSISNSGERARDEAILTILPLVDRINAQISDPQNKDGLRFLRILRLALG